MSEKLLFKSKKSLLSKPIGIRIEGVKHYAVIEAEEEHRIWGEKLFPGDDRDYEVQMHPVEIIWEINDNQLLKTLKDINKLKSPLILFTFEGVKPRVLLDVKVVEREELEHLENNMIIFPYNPKKESEKRIEREEQRLLDLDPNIWING